jgi:hypothetical protein
MKAIPQPNATRRLGAPILWNHETDGICHTLDIIDQDGEMISAWSPTDAELAKLNAGAPLFLRIMGTVHPVVAMSVGYETHGPAGEKHCAVCGERQFDTPSGICCVNGHGGADSK